MRGLSVVIPSKTASNLTACLNALRKQDRSVRVIVIDDGIPHAPDDCTGCWQCDMDPMGRDFVIDAIKPFIFARNCNAGIRAVGDDDVILCNDDALLKTPGGFTLLQKEAEAHPEYGIISATTNLAGNTDQFPQGIGLRDAGSKCVAFVCVLIPRRTIDAVGLLDERFTAYGWEDNDYCRRVRMAGLKVGIFDGCYVDHGSLKSTFRGEPTAAGNIYAGQEIYLQKWGDLA